MSEKENKYWYQLSDEQKQKRLDKNEKYKCEWAAKPLVEDMVDLNSDRTNTYFMRNLEPIFLEFSSSPEPKVIAVQIKEECAPESLKEKFKNDQD